MKCYGVLLLLLTTLISASQLVAKTPEDAQIPRIERTVIEETNLQKLSEIMQRDKLGLMILFHAAYCDYCERLENDLIQPMVRSGDYDDKILIRKIQVDGVYDLVNFNGQRISSNQLSILYDASLTPTLVFVDANGEEQAERILGYNTPELFGAYVDRAIDKLYKAVTGN